MLMFAAIPCSVETPRVKCELSTGCTFQALVYEHPGQELEIELFDEDPDKDDFLGR